MRVLIDECLPPGLRESLAALGYEAETVRLLPTFSQHVFSTLENLILGIRGFLRP